VIWHPAIDSQDADPTSGRRLGGLHYRVCNIGDIALEHITVTTAAGRPVSSYADTLAAVPESHVPRTMRPRPRRW
jgi:hypothetical protein